MVVVIEVVVGDRSRDAASAIVDRGLHELRSVALASSPGVVPIDTKVSSRAEAAGADMITQRVG